MSQISGPISIHDGAGTPVAHSFAPMKVAPSESVFAEKTSGVSAGYIELTVLSSWASSQRPTNRVDINLEYPILQTVSGVSSVASVGRFKGYFVIPDTWAAIDRAHLHAYVANALDAAVVKAVIKDLDPMY